MLENSAREIARSNAIARRGLRIAQRKSNPLDVDRSAIGTVASAAREKRDRAIVALMLRIGVQAFVKLRTRGKCGNCQHVRENNANQHLLQSHHRFANLRHGESIVAGAFRNKQLIENRSCAAGNEDRTNFQTNRAVPAMAWETLFQHSLVLTRRVLLP